MTSRRAYLGLGTNLGDRREHLASAIAVLDDVTAVSRVYETAPVGGPSGQGAYLNMVVELSTSRSPEELLAVCHSLERAADRVRLERWGPRTLDVDILWIDGVRLDTPRLVIPHPRMHLRRFVLAPLAELAPELCPEGWADSLEGDVVLLGPLDPTLP